MVAALFGFYKKRRFLTPKPQKWSKTGFFEVFEGSKCMVAALFDSDPPSQLINLSIFIDF